MTVVYDLDLDLDPGLDLFPPKYEYVQWREPFDEMIARLVPQAAAILDEHVPGWAKRITRPLDIRSCHNCILGQVFDEAPRRFFGLLRGRDEYGSGFSRGLDFFNSRSVLPPFVFSCPDATPHWRAEIARRR